MRHEPECAFVDDHILTPDDMATCSFCAALRCAYRRGYNDHAYAQAHADALYGIRANQHGAGENP